MSDLIDRQAAINALTRKMRPHDNGDGTITIHVMSEGLVKETLNDLPPAQPEIIRCKDCKYASPNGKYGCKAYHFKLYETHGMEADDFCSRAERKEE